MPSIGSYYPIKYDVLPVRDSLLDHTPLKADNCQPFFCLISPLGSRFRQIALFA